MEKLTGDHPNRNRKGAFQYLCIFHICHFLYANSDLARIGKLPWKIGRPNLEIFPILFSDWTRDRNYLQKGLLLYKYISHQDHLSDRHNAIGKYLYNK